MLTARWWPVLVIVGCVDQPVRIVARDGTPADRLSQLGVFAGDPAAQLPADGVIPYDVIAPLWSDGALKQRFVIAPAPLATTDDRWTIGAGTYLVKTFSYGGRLVETRVIAFAGSGVSAATYVWNDAQTEAFTSGGNLDIPVTWSDADGVHHQDHHIPGTSQCDSCHRGGALGIRTPELADQLPALVAAGVADAMPATFTPFVDPYSDAALDDRASSYLEINCAHCHSPGGEAQGTHADWRRDHLHENVCRGASYGVDGADRVIEPGRPDRSVMIRRMRSTDAFVHMPRGPSHVQDERGISMLESWITAMPAGCP